MGKRHHKHIGAWLIVCLVLLVGYTNCAEQFSPISDSGVVISASSSSSTSSLPAGSYSADLCEDQLIRNFATGYHPFLKQNCAICHASGPGKGRFANNDTLTAFNDFQQVGYTKVSTNATSSAHNPPYSGPQHVQTVNELRLTWSQGQEEYAKCKNIAVTEPNNVEDLITTETMALKIPTMDFDQERTVIWTLNTDLRIILSRIPSLPALPGARLTLTIGKKKTSGGETYYNFRAPSLMGSSVDVHVKGIHLKLNGRLQKYPTTFRYVDTGVRSVAGVNDTRLISAGSLVSPGALSDQDTIAVVFEKIEPTTLPPLPPPLTATFAGAALRTHPGAAGFIDIDVQLSADPVDLVTMNVSESSNPLCGQNNGETLVTANGTNCLPDVYQYVCPGGGCTAGTLGFKRARSAIGGTYNRFDWDFKFQGSTLTFRGTERRQTVRIYLSKDIRKEANRLLTLQLDSGSPNAQVSGQTTIRIVIPKASNPDPTPGIATFSELMNTSSGVLGTNCTKCHNSVDRNGGYDMTNYEEMISKGVLVPGSTTSLMYRRINGSDPDAENVSPMPLDGFLDERMIQPVEKWILDGAKNN